MPTKTNKIAALDVGDVRIGVAITPIGVRIAQPYGHFVRDDFIVKTIQDFVQKESIDTLIVGLPLGMQGQETRQTQLVRDFTAMLKQHLSVPILFQDETLTSVKAEQELINRKKVYKKSDIDALAACYILEDYLEGQQELLDD
jgi:putative holliday junction resolvase